MLRFKVVEIPPCIVRYTTTKGDTTIHSLIDITLNEKTKTGLITTDGVVIGADQVRHVLHRRTRFTWYRSEYEIILSSKSHEKMNDDNTDDDILDSHFPAFYSRNDYMVNFILKNLGEKGVVFYDGTIPLFYCRGY